MPPPAAVTLAMLMTTAELEELEKPGDDLLPGSRSRRWSGGRWRCNWSRRPRHERRMDYRRRSALI